MARPKKSSSPRSPCHAVPMPCRAMSCRAVPRMCARCALNVCCALRACWRACAHACKEVKRSHSAVLLLFNNYYLKLLFNNDSHSACGRTLKQPLPPPAVPPMMAGARLSALSRHLHCAGVDMPSEMPRTSRYRAITIYAITINAITIYAENEPI